MTTSSNPNKYRHWLLRISSISVTALEAAHLHIKGNCQPHDVGQDDPPWAGERFYLVPEEEYERLMDK